MDLQVLQPWQIWPGRYYHHLDAFSFGVWNLNPGGGRFFKAMRRWISTVVKLDILKAAGVLWAEAHDTDLLDLVLGEEAAALVGYPEGMTEEQKMELLLEAVKLFRAELDKRGMYCGAFTMNLFNSEAAWNFGNYGSEVDEVRELAIMRTLFGIRMAVEELLASVYIYWVGTNGTDGRFSAFHPTRINRTRQALVWIMDTAVKLYKDRMIPFAFEPKPEEPKYKMYHGTAASALACIFAIATYSPDLAKLMGLNIEVAHSLMSKTDPAMDYGEALAYGKLFHTHENGQGEPAYDRDLAVGDDDPMGLVDRMWQLSRGGYRGLLGGDVQPLPQDTDEQIGASVRRSVEMLKWAVWKAEGLDSFRMARLQANHNQSGILAYTNHAILGAGKPE